MGEIKHDLQYKLLYSDTYLSFSEFRTTNELVTEPFDRPEIETIYYHVDIEENSNYEQWKSVCSQNPGIWTRDMTWEHVIANDPQYEVCRIQTIDPQSLGRAKVMGWADAPHLHNEVYIDGNNARDQNPSGYQFDRGQTEREDPLIPFVTIR